MKRRKGRESPPEERLYRRLLSHGLEKDLSLELVLETIQTKESNPKLNEKQLRSQIQETIVHACRKGELFIGDSGYGSLGLAIAFSQYILCENQSKEDSCGQCPACKKINELQHPDLHFSFPTVQSISKSSNPFHETCR